MWFIHDPERLKKEVADIEALLAGGRGVVAVTPCMMKGLQFAVEFDLMINGETLPFKLIYPSFFPETPPAILPRDGRRHSDHQWGRGGELCLEYRTDNWDPSVTGAMMIESSYRLLSGEQPAQNQRAIVPSEHQVSLGQQLRGAVCRAFLTHGLRDHIATLEFGSGHLCGVVETVVSPRTWTAYVASVGATSAPRWREDSIPLARNQSIPGLLVRLASLDGLVIFEQVDLDDIIASATIQDVMLPANSAAPRFTILCDGTMAQFYFSYINEGAWKIIPYSTIDISEETRGRLPESYPILPTRKVGIIGCGSLGSKVATSLARSGIRSFVLVDNDILKPGNLVRNDLGAESLGAHKVDALKERLGAVAPNVEVIVSRVDLGGQESSGSTAMILDVLAECHLLIDATAESRAFNFVASVARRAQCPMIWAEIYAGGIGGFVARLRPGIEPPPHVARRQYLAWCRNQAVAWHGEGEQYDAQRADRPPIIADDADVGVIAAHTARMAIDVLVQGTMSNFPHPAYVIGLARDWVFEEPFDTKPIDFLAEGEWQLPSSKEQVDVALEYLCSLLDKTDDADRAGD